jgi:hypothetical protein
LYARGADAHGEGEGARSDVSGVLQRLEHTGARMGWLHPAHNPASPHVPQQARNALLASSGHSDFIPKVQDNDIR